MSLLSATPPIFLVRAVRLSVPYLGHASNVTGQDCQTDSVFLLSATPPALPVRTVRRTQCSFSRPRLLPFRPGLSCCCCFFRTRPRLQFSWSELSDSVFLLSATPPALPVRTVRQTQCYVSRSHFQPFRPGLFFVVLFSPSLPRL